MNDSISFNCSNSSKKWVSLFFLYLGLVVVTVLIAQSESYRYRDMDGLPLGLIELFFLIPVFLYVFIFSIRMVIGLFKGKMIRQGFVGLMAAFVILLTFLYGFDIYESVMTFGLSSLTTQQIFDSRDKRVRYFSARILSKRQDDLLKILKNQGDWLDDFEEGRLLHLLKNNPDPIVDEYVLKLIKKTMLKGWPNYQTAFEIILERKYPDYKQTTKELVEYARNTFMDDKKTVDFERGLNILTESFEQYKAPYLKNRPATKNVQV